MPDRSRIESILAVVATDSKGEEHIVMAKSRAWPHPLPMIEYNDENSGLAESGEALARDNGEVYELVEFTARVTVKKLGLAS